MANFGLFWLGKTLLIVFIKCREICSPSNLEEGKKELVISRLGQVRWHACRKKEKLWLWRARRSVSGESDASTDASVPSPAPWLTSGNKATSDLQRELPPELRALPPKQQVAAPVVYRTRLRKAPAPPVPGAVGASVGVLKKATTADDPQLMAAVMVTLPVRVQAGMLKAAIECAPRRGDSCRRGHWAGRGFGARTRRGVAEDHVA